MLIQNLAEQKGMYSLLLRIVLKDNWAWNSAKNKNNIWQYENSVFSPNVEKYRPEKNSVIGHFSCSGGDLETYSEPNETTKIKLFTKK